MKKVISMIKPSPKVSGVPLSQLKKIEKVLGAVFPDEYKELFLETNGAVFGKWTLYSIQAGEQQAKNMDFIEQNKEKRPENLPTDMVCIGESGNGDRLCYRIRKKFMQELIFVWSEQTGTIDCKALTLREFIDWYVPTNVQAGKQKTVGTFIVESGKLIVTDPCYQTGEEELQIILSNVKKGKWTASITYDEEQVIEKLIALYEGKKPSGKWHVCDKPIAVDSAKAGIFDIAIFRRDDAIQYEVKNVFDIEIDEDGLLYYVACCDVIDSDEEGGVVPGGAVSMSGFGDGMYDVKVKYNISREIVGVMIDYGEEE